MRRVLLAPDSDPAWSKRAAEALAGLRGQYTFLEGESAPLLDRGTHLEWWTFAGGAANVLLARMLQAELGEKVIAHNTALVFREEAARSIVRVKGLLREFAAAGRPTREDALAFAEGPSRRRVSKFELCVPERLLLRLLAERTVDVDGARRALQEI